MASFFSTLVLETDEARRGFETHPTTLDAVAHGLTAQRYCSFLLEIYHVVWHFNPVCAAAASRIDDGLRDVRYFMCRHIHEECGHELWVADDLRCMGIGPDELEAYQPSSVVLSLCGYNYWATERRHACSALGMLYALEVIASVYCGVFSTALKKSLNLKDDRGLRFLTAHATLDSHHLADLRSVLDRIADPQAQRAIIESTRVNFDQLTRMVASI